MTCLPALRPAILGLLLAAPACGTGNAHLPPGADLGPYSDTGKPETYQGLRLYAYMDGGADIFFEYGFETAWVRHYREDGRELVVELFGMKDETAAAGIYSYMRRPGSEAAIAGGCRGSLTDTQAQISRGRFFLVCRYADPMAEDVGQVRDLCGRLVGRLEGECGEGRLFTGLPEEARISGSEVLLAGPVGLNIRPWLASVKRSGFRRGWLSDYRAAGAIAQVLLAEYESAAAAENAARGFTDCTPPTCVLHCDDVRVIVVRAPRTEGDELHRLAERFLAAPVSQPSR